MGLFTRSTTTAPVAAASPPGRRVLRRRHLGRRRHHRRLHPRPHPHAASASRPATRWSPRSAASSPSSRAAAHLDTANPSASSAKVNIRAASIYTGQADRDGHLRSADFFDAETFPSSPSSPPTSTAPTPTTWTVTGDLTIKGVTNPVTIDFESTGSAKDPFGNLRVGFEGSTSINRKDWGLTWNAALEAGGVLVSEKIKLEFDVSAIAVAAPPPDPRRRPRGVDMTIVRRPPQPRGALRRRPRARRWTSTPTPSAWRSSPASRARTPPSCGCPARATTTTSACSASARTHRRSRRGGIGLYHLAWQVDTIEELEQARQTLADARRLHRRVQPRRHQERLRRRPRRQRVRGHVDAAARRRGASIENAAPVERLDLAGEVRRWGGVRTAGRIVPRTR